MDKKLDLKRELKKFYNPSPGISEIIEVPRFQFLMIDGMGMDFEKGDSQTAIEALFSVSYKVKFLAKKTLGLDYVVMPLEGLWWADDLNDFVNGNRDKWRWTYMIMQPEFVTIDLVGAVIDDVVKSKDLKTARQLRLEDYQEGLSAQIMHIGPFADEHPNIMKIHQLIEDNHGTFDGKKQKHHEIYLSDFRKVAPEKMKTILRQPFQYH
jgi:hypothetical protein